MPEAFCAGRVERSSYSASSAFDIRQHFDSACEPYRNHIGTHTASESGCNQVQQQVSLPVSEPSQEAQTPPHAIWILAYGSLCWKPGFAYDLAVNGYIKDWKRVFYQGDSYHRGTSAAPGRTVTLISSPGSATWGTAFRLSGTFTEQQETLQYMEWRERQYDLRLHLPVFSADSDTEPAVASAITYVAGDDPIANPGWLGPAEPEVIAQQIAAARGASGWNCEYLHNLTKAMKSMDAVDPELTWLDKRVRQIRSECQMRHIDSCANLGVKAPTWHLQEACTDESTSAWALRHLCAPCLDLIHQASSLGSRTLSALQELR